MRTSDDKRARDGGRMLVGAVSAFLHLVALIAMVIVAVTLLPRACETVGAALPPSVERVMVQADTALEGKVRRLEARIEGLEARMEVEEAWTRYWRGDR